MLVAIRCKSASGKPFLDDVAGGKMQRMRTAHRDVIDRPMDCQRPDVAAGKEQRRNHIAVRRHHHAACRHVERGLVVAAIEQRIVEGLPEDLIDELSHSPPAGSVGKVDATVPDIQLARTKLGRAQATAFSATALALSLKRP